MQQELLTRENKQTNHAKILATTCMMIYTTRRPLDHTQKTTPGKNNKN